MLPNLMPLLLTAATVLHPHRLESIGRQSEPELRALAGALDQQAMPEKDRTYHRAHLRLALARKCAPSAAEALLEEARGLLEGHRDPEYQALLALVYLEQMGRGGFSTRMRLARPTQQLLEGARAQAPNSPRILVASGIFTLGMPALFGGGPAKAIPLFEAAVHAANAKPLPPEASAPSWGRCEAHAWLAWAYAKAGRWTEGDREAQKALALDDRYGFLHQKVLPDLHSRGQR